MFNKVIYTLTFAFIAIGLTTLPVSAQIEVEYVGKEKKKKKRNIKKPISMKDWPSDAEILDKDFPSSKRPKKPNAGTRAGYDVPDLKTKFTFNRKIAYQITSKGKTIQSYFYINTINGNSMMDMAAWGALAPEKVPVSEGAYISDVIGNRFQYFSTPESKFSMKSGIGADASLIDLYSETIAGDFFAGFKKTGKVVNKGKGEAFKRVEFSGPGDNGNIISIWLSDPQDMMLDISKTYMLVGLMPLGWVANNKGKTYMITCIQDGDMELKMTKYENANQTFNGASYKSIVDAPGGPGKGIDMAEYEEGLRKMQAEIDAETDPEVKRLMQKQFDEARKFMDPTMAGMDKYQRTGDNYDIHSAMEQGAQDADFYEMQINAFKMEEIELQKRYDDLVSMKYSDYYEHKKSVDKAKCELDCNRRMQGVLKGYQTRANDIKRTYAKDTEKKQDKLDELGEQMSRDIVANRCMCD